VRAQDGRTAPVGTQRINLALSECWEIPEVGRGENHLDLDAPGLRLSRLPMRPRAAAGQPLGHLRGHHGLALLNVLQELHTSRQAQERSSRS